MQFGAIEYLLAERKLRFAVAGCGPLKLELDDHYGDGLLHAFASTGKRLT